MILDILDWRRLAIVDCRISEPDGVQLRGQVKTFKLFAPANAHLRRGTLRNCALRAAPRSETQYPLLHPRGLAMMFHRSKTDIPSLLVSRPTLECCSRRCLARGQSEAGSQL